MYAIYSLCAHSEYVELLRTEATRKLDPKADNPFKHMVLLDAFLRESARLNPLDARKLRVVSFSPGAPPLRLSVSIQRKVMQPFVLPSGAQIPVGNLIAVPQQAVLRNGEIYHDPESFNPFRYLSAEGKLHHGGFTTRYTDVNSAYPYWGSPRKPW